MSKFCTTTKLATYFLYNKRPIDWSLKGESYVWMLPIYGSIAVFARILLPLVENLHVVFRMLIYGVVILIIEYIAGFVLKQLTGRCPWHYEARWAVHNLIRLDYLPFWMGFGLLVEYYHRYF